MNPKVVITIISILGAILIGYGVIQALRTQNSTPRATPTPTPKAINLTDYVDDSDAQVRLIIDGRIQAKEKHISQTISVSLANRDIAFFRAYSPTAETAQGFDNNQPAFEDFITALQNAGFVSSKENEKAADSTEGLCPQGLRFTYEFITGGQVQSQLWSTSCGNPTDFTGNAATIRTLFIAQIPDYSKIAAPYAQQ